MIILKSEVIRSQKINENLFLMSILLKVTMFLNLIVELFFMTLMNNSLKTFWKSFAKNTVLKIDNDKLV